MITCAVCGTDQMRKAGLLVAPEHGNNVRYLHLYPFHTQQVRHFVAELNQQHRDALHAQ